MSLPEIKVLPDLQSIAREAADRISRIAAESIDRANRFSIALSGGSAPKPLYELLAREPYRSQIDWARVRIFFGDERCVPPDHDESNFRLAQQTLLSKVPVPGDNIYRMRGEIDPQAAAKEYGQLLKENFGEDGGVDVNLLGMGEDGHTASLFPGTDVLNETKHRAMAHFVKDSTTGPSWRITMTAAFINRSKHIIILVAGEKKAATVQQVLEGPKDPQRLPIQLIDPVSGQLTWLLDAAAAGMRQQ